MSQEFDNLEAQVSASTTVEKSAVILINGFKARLDAAGVDPVKLAALSNDLKVNADDLAAAVVANTPAAPPA